MKDFLSQVQGKTTPSMPTNGASSAGQSVGAGAPTLPNQTGLAGPNVYNPVTQQAGNIANLSDPYSNLRNSFSGMRSAWSSAENPYTDDYRKSIINAGIGDVQNQASNNLGNIRQAMAGRFGAAGGATTGFEAQAIMQNELNRGNQIGALDSNARMQQFDKSANWNTQRNNALDQFSLGQAGGENQFNLGQAAGISNFGLDQARTAANLYGQGQDYTANAIKNQYLEPGLREQLTGEQLANQGKDIGNQKDQTLLSQLQALSPYMTQAQKAQLGFDTRNADVGTETLNANEGLIQPEAATKFYQSQGALKDAETENAIKQFPILGTIYSMIKGLGPKGGEAVGDLASKAPSYLSQLNGLGDAFSLDGLPDA